jgi:hypothetical protein
MSSMSTRPADQPQPPADREEGENGLLLTGEHLELDPGFGLHPGEHRTDVGGVAHRRGSEGHQVRAAHRGCRVGGGTHGANQVIGTLRGDLSTGVHVLGQPQHRLLRNHRHRVPATVRVHYQQVDGVGTHIEHAEPHGRSGYCLRCRLS